MNNSRNALFAHQSTNSCYTSRIFRFACQLLLAAGACFCSLTLFAQTPDSRATGEASESWSATTDIETKDVNPARIIESQQRNGNHTVNKKSVQVRGFDGHFQPYYDIETEVVQVDSTTARTITRTFGIDGSGAKTLLQISEEEKHTGPSGESNVIRITSNPDGDGRLQPVQREIVETRNIGTGVEETKSTVMLPSINGGLAPVLKTQENRTRRAKDTIETEKTTLLQDGGGKWQVNEIRRTTTTPEGTMLRTEERVSRLDFEGNLAEISRVVSTESASDSGEKRNRAETYSIDVPGITRDGKLHLVERATTQNSSSNGEQVTEKQVEQLNPGDPNSGLRLSFTTTEVERTGPSGLEATGTTRARDADGSFRIVSIQTTDSDRYASDQSLQTSSEKPGEKK